MASSNLTGRVTLPPLSNTMSQSGKAKIGELLRKSAGYDAKIDHCIVCFAINRPGTNKKNKKFDQLSFNAIFIHPITKEVFFSPLELRDPLPGVDVITQTHHVFKWMDRNSAKKRITDLVWKAHQHRVGEDVEMPEFAMVNLSSLQILTALGSLVIDAVGNEIVCDGGTRLRYCWETPNPFGERAWIVGWDNDSHKKMAVDFHAYQVVNSNFVSKTVRLTNDPPVGDDQMRSVRTDCGFMEESSSTTLLDSIRITAGIDRLEEFEIEDAYSPERINNAHKDLVYQFLNCTADRIINTFVPHFEMHDLTMENIENTKAHVQDSYTLTPVRVRDTFAQIAEAVRAYDNNNNEDKPLKNHVTSTRQFITIMNLIAKSSWVLWDAEMSTGLAHRRVCIIQFLCSADPNRAHVISLCTPEMYFQAKRLLRTVFEDPEIVKVAFSVSSLDAPYLYRDFGVEIINGIDLQVFEDCKKPNNEYFNLVDYAKHLRKITQERCEELNCQKARNHKKDLSRGLDDSDASHVLDGPSGDSVDYCGNDVINLGLIVAGKTSSVEQMTDQDLRDLIEGWKRAHSSLNLEEKWDGGFQLGGDEIFNKYYFGILLSRTIGSGFGSSFTNDQIVIFSNYYKGLCKWTWKHSIKYCVKHNTYELKTRIAMAAIAATINTDVRNEVDQKLFQTLVSVFSYARSQEDDNSDNAPGGE